MCEELKKFHPRRPIKLCDASAGSSLIGQSLCSNILSLPYSYYPVQSYSYIKDLCISLFEVAVAGMNNTLPP
jgi:hypothetical protein